MKSTDINPLVSPEQFLDVYSEDTQFDTKKSVRQIISAFGSVSAYLDRLHGDNANEIHVDIFKRSGKNYSSVSSHTVSQFSSDQSESQERPQPIQPKGPSSANSTEFLKYVNDDLHRKNSKLEMKVDLLETRLEKTKDQLADAELRLKTIDRENELNNANSLAGIISETKPLLETFIQAKVGGGNQMSGASDLSQDEEELLRFWSAQEEAAQKLVVNVLGLMSSGNTAFTKSLVGLVKMHNKQSKAQEENVS